MLIQPKILNHRGLFKKHDTWGYSYRPNLNIRFNSPDLSMPGYFLKTNNYGFRTFLNNDEFLSSKKTKILIIGCSFTAGDGVANSCRFSDLIKHYDTNIEIYNAALPGSGHDQQYLILRDLLPILRPNIVLFSPYTGCANRNLVSERSFIDSLHGGLTRRPKPYFIIKNNNLVLQNVPVPNWKSFTHDYSNFLRLGADFESISRSVFKKISSIFLFPSKYPNLSPQGQILTTSIIKAISITTNNYGAKLIIMPLPSRKDLITNQINAVLSFYYSLSNESNFHVIDINSSFKTLSSKLKDNLFIPSDGHYSQFGHREICNFLINSKCFN
jgi:hypothetical protein